MSAPRLRKRTVIGLIVLVLLAAMAFAWSHLINSMLPADNRPAAVPFAAAVPLTEPEFKVLAGELADLGSFPHAERFAEAGIRTYDGPSTCLECHEKILVRNAGDDQTERDLLDDVTASTHYRFFTTDHPNVWGFNGELADNFPMGKLNRPCPKPGSFAMSAWAEIVVTQRGDTLSEGCGQCHIGGQYQAPLGEMMPLYGTLEVEKQAIDCLICHAALYDMDRKQVVIDPDGRQRWDQDRTLRAAATVGIPGSEACLRCHQHNFGGDIYIDPDGEEFMPSLTATGADRPRVLHPGAKRGTPFSPTWDVHAAAGVTCLECHHADGHRIAKGTHTTTIMANDRPEVEVSCLDCHNADLHDDGTEAGRELDRHCELIACQTCHIPSLHPDNVSRRDFGVTEFEEHEGIHIYHDELKLNQPGEGIAYVWWNGDATFLGNPIGDNPNGAGLYRFYTGEHAWPEFADFDYAGWYEDVMRPIARAGRPSKLYAMKRFNGRQHIDLQNIGPFGGMFVPYNLPAYYRTGDADAATRAEMQKSMMKMMYGWMFKIYMLDKFIGFMDVDGWNTGAYDDVAAGRRVEPRWLPNDAMLEISHGIRLEGALNCADCHGPEGVLDWEDLGYTPAEIEKLVEAR